MSDSAVVLTELRPTDAEPLFGWINDPELVRLHGIYRPIDWKAHLKWMESLSTDASRVVFAIRLGRDQTPIGLVQLQYIHPVHRSAEVFIRLGPSKDRGKGYGSEALRHALAFAFADLGLVRVFTHVFADNAAAVRAYEKAGFALEGRLRRAAFIAGKWTDVLVMAALAP